jgi:UDP-GlcNAc:undecaprenyl-phosphate GlcNAc-1-phosphate transferase
MKDFLYLSGLSLICGMIVSYATLFFLKKYISNLGGDKGKENEIRWSKQRVPTMGGIILIAAFLSGYIFQIALSGFSNTSFLFGVIFMFAVGLYDDLNSIKASTKFLAQVSIALGIVISGFGLKLFGTAPDFILTMLILVGMMNSLNMIDNMDGVAASVTLVFVAGAILLMGWLAGFGLFGGLLLFLFQNRKPAKIYLGDSGSLFLGFIMGFLSIQFVNSILFTSANRLLDAGSILASIFAFPVADTLVVIINRLLAGISPATGGKDHSTHHLVYAGVQESFVPVYYMLISITGWYILYLGSSKGCFFSDQICGHVIHILSFGFFFLVFSILWIISRYNIKKGRYTYIK